MKKVYIITGANGFLGNHIVRKLAAVETNEVRALVLPEDRMHVLDGVHCNIYRGDVTDKSSLHAIFEGTENAELYVVHCAAIVSIKTRYNPRVYDVNVNGTKHVIEKVLEKSAKLVYVNSVHAIPEKPNHEVMTEIYDFDPEQVVGQYAKTKAIAAKALLEAVEKRNLNACIMHPSGLIGPNDFGNSHLTQLIIDFVNGRLRACVRGGYDFVDVRDVADAIICACEKGQRGACYILSNRYMEVKELLDLISDVWHTKRIKTVLPMWFAKLTAPLSELYYAFLKQPPLYTRYSLYTLKSNSNFSNEKAQRELGYRNRDLRETIEDTLHWLKANGRIN